MRGWCAKAGSAPRLGPDAREVNGRATHLRVEEVDIGPGELLVGDAGVQHGVNDRLADDVPRRGVGRRIEDVVLEDADEHVCGRVSQRSSCQFGFHAPTGKTPSDGWKRRPSSRTLDSFACAASGFAPSLRSGQRETVKEIAAEVPRAKMAFHVSAISSASW